MKLTHIIITLCIAITAGVMLAPKAIFSGSPDSGTQKQEAQLTENNQTRLLKKVPAPQLDDSQERRNLVERLKRLNDGNKIGYAALIGPQGQLVAYYTVKGKVSSLESYLTTPQQIVHAGGGLCDYNSSNCYVTDSPDLDGSYGKNPSGIFFFTTTGAMVEWAGNYMYSDRPLDYTTKPILVEQGQ